MFIQLTIRKLSVLNSLPDELSFINEFRLENVSLGSAKWLISDFRENFWRCRFGDSTINIDFAITLADSSLLTHPSNSRLLETIKRYLCSQNHPAVVGVAILADCTGKTLLRRALHVLDYFLLRNHFINDGCSGFRQLTTDDIHEYIDTVSSGRAIKDNFYEPEQRIVDFIRTVKVTAEEIELARRRVPEIFDTTALELPFELEEEQVQVARIWLYARRFYCAGSGEHLFAFRLSATRLLKYLMGNRVLGNLQFLSLDLDFLSFRPREHFIRERQATPVQPGGDDERANAEHVQSYLQALAVMEIDASPDYRLVSEDALTALDEKEALKHGRLKQKKRFATLPFEVANQSFRNAIEFYLEYGSDLVDYYLALAERNWQGGTLTDMPESLQKLGIKRFENEQADRVNFFTELRNGSSLYQMLQVLFGAIMVLVNTLMARRASELLGLTADSIVKDGPHVFLAFDLGKANVGELRKRSLRPLPALGAEALNILVKLGKRLNELGHESSPKIFSRIQYGHDPNFTPYGLSKIGISWSMLCLDRFCDYIETPTDSEGRRYYIRPHQLRRNFAMLFFWQGSFGGVEVLRYFLGHQKPSVTYRYVTEPMKGAVLRQVKAKVATELIKADSTATESLAAFICERYGLTIDDLHILPEADVVAYVEELLASKEAEIEPEFIEGPNREEYRILYKVRALTSSRGESNG